MNGDRGDKSSSEQTFINEVFLNERQGPKGKPSHSAYSSLNTVRSYKNAIDHYRFTYGKQLPTSAASIIEYLSVSRDSFSPGTLQIHLSALSDWHSNQGFADPTKDEAVREFMDHIKRTSDHVPCRRQAVTFNDLTKMDDCLDEDAHDEHSELFLPSTGEQLRSLRDRVILLLGYWCSLSAKQIVGLEINDLEISKARGMLINLSPSTNHRAKMLVPYLKHHCPVKATEEWIAAIFSNGGPLLRPINRWGEIKNEKLHSQSINLILDTVANNAGVIARITSTGLSNGLTANEEAGSWDRESILAHVGWQGYPSRHVMSIR